jgi:hypothetical protein
MFYFRDETTYRLNKGLFVYDAVHDKELSDNSTVKG